MNVKKLTPVAVVLALVFGFVGLVRGEELSAQAFLAQVKTQAEAARTALREAKKKAEADTTKIDAETRTVCEELVKLSDELAKADREEAAAAAKTGRQVRPRATQSYSPGFGPPPADSTEGLAQNLERCKAILAKPATK